jgi:hypothetical protein
MRGRKPKQQSRSEEFRKTLAAWKQIPVAFRPSLRALARELGTSHQLLGHYLLSIENGRLEKELEAFRAKAEAKNLSVTTAVERRYLNWLRKIEERQARSAAETVAWARQHAALIDRLERCRSISGDNFDR